MGWGTAGGMLDMGRAMALVPYSSPRRPLRQVLAPARLCQEHDVYPRSLLLKGLHQVISISLCLAEAAEEDPYALGAKATTMCQPVSYCL